MVILMVNPLEKVSYDAKKIYRYLAMYRGLYVSTSRIARKFDMDPRTAKAYLDELRKKNLIKVRKKTKKRTIARRRDGSLIYDTDTRLLLWSIKTSK